MFRVPEFSLLDVLNIGVGLYLNPFSKKTKL